SNCDSQTDLFVAGPPETRIRQVLDRKLSPRRIGRFHPALQFRLMRAIDHFTRRATCRPTRPHRDFPRATPAGSAPTLPARGGSADSSLPPPLTAVTPADTAR